MNFLLVETWFPWTELNHLAGTSDHFHPGFVLWVYTESVEPPSPGQPLRYRKVDPSCRRCVRAERSPCVGHVLLLTLFIDIIPISQTDWGKFFSQQPSTLPPGGTWGRLVRWVPGAQSLRGALSFGHLDLRGFVQVRRLSSSLALTLHLTHLAFGTQKNTGTISL